MSRLNDTHVPVTTFDWESYKVTIVQIYEQVWLRSKDTKPTPVRKKVKVDGAKYCCYGYEVRFANVLIDCDYEEQYDIGACIENALSDVKSHRKRMKNIATDYVVNDWIKNKVEESNNGSES